MNKKKARFGYARGAEKNAQVISLIARFDTYKKEVMGKMQRLSGEDFFFSKRLIVLYNFQPRYRYQQKEILHKMECALSKT